MLKLQFKQVLGMFDPQNNGTVDSPEFAKFCKVEDAGDAGRLAKELQAEAKRMLQNAEHDIYVIFSPHVHGPDVPFHKCQTKISFLLTQFTCLFSLFTKFRTLSN